MMVRYQLQTPKRQTAKPAEERIEELEKRVLSTGRLLRKTRAELAAMEAQITALEAAQQPAPATAETVTISKASHSEAIKVLKLVFRNPDDDEYATTNRIIHVIGLLDGSIPPLPF